MISLLRRSEAERRMVRRLRRSAVDEYSGDFDTDEAQYLPCRRSFHPGISKFRHLVMTAIEHGVCCRTGGQHEIDKIESDFVKLHQSL